MKTQIESMGQDMVYLHSLVAFLDLADVRAACEGKLPKRWECVQNRLRPVLLVHGQQNPEHLGARHVELALGRKLVNCSLHFWFNMCFGGAWCRR